MPTLAQILTSRTGIALLSLGFLTGLLRERTLAQTPCSLHHRYILVLDPGHGGRDPGCIGTRGTLEKDIALAVAKKTGELIQQYAPNIKVIYTRTRDQFVELYRRPQLANQKKADLFVSIHCNSAPDARAHGTETYTMGLHRTEANLRVAMRENEVILKETNYQEHYGDFDPRSPEAYIMFSLYQHAFLEESIEVARRVEEAFQRIGRKSRGVRQAGFLVLYKTAMPSILIELGFLTNPQEEAFLRSKEGQQRMALALYQALCSYFQYRDSLLLARKQTSAPDTTSSTLTTTKALPPGYYVQFLATRTRREPTTLSLGNPPGKIWIIHANGWYKYLLGPYDQLRQARTIQRQLHKQGFPDAFVRKY